ncbi:hypothetical protein L484_015864 [Morus notabilis]|uniref:Uncharacterized protein n=1 Tax=Morus notabilis TaxID=981085 RepID=W9QZK2_9ROSA|nr:hypothetical protein L484_015864 [Morus notabilis]
MSQACVFFSRVFMWWAVAFLLGRDEHSITAGPPPPPFHGADFLAPAIDAGADEIRTTTI